MSGLRAEEIFVRGVNAWVLIPVAGPESAGGLCPEWKIFTAPVQATLGFLHAATDAVIRQAESTLLFGGILERHSERSDVLGIAGDQPQVVAAGGGSKRSVRPR